MGEIDLQVLLFVCDAVYRRHRLSMWVGENMDLPSKSFCCGDWHSSFSV